MKNSTQKFLPVPMNMITVALTLGILAGCSSNRHITQQAASTITSPSQTVEIKSADTPETPARKPPQFTTIYFDFDKSSIRSDQHQTLNSNAQLLIENNDVRILIEGHCDERGTNEYNLALGQRRADAVKLYLADYGIDTARISAISYGEEHPANYDHDEHAWELNRRCEFKVATQ